MTQPDFVDIIATKILFDAKEAIKGLQEFNKAVDSPTAKLAKLKQIIIEVAAQADISFTQAAAAVAKIGGKAGMSPEAIRGLGKELQAVHNEAQGLGADGAKAADTMSGAFSRTFSAVNALRIALGAIVSMVLFQLIQAFTQFSNDAVKQFTELEDTIFRLQNVERELSFSGIEISMSGLKKGIQDIKKLLPIFSEEDISSLVGKVAISTKELGYSEKQILDLAKAIAVLNVRSTENETLNQTSSKVITALLSGTTKGVSGLGLQLSDTVIQTKAVQMGLLEAGKSLDDLGKHDRDLVKLQIIMDSTAGELGTINDYLDTNSAKLKENAATWADVKTAAGGFLTTIAPSLSAVNSALVDAINTGKALYIVFETFITWAKNNFLILAKFIEDPVQRVKDLIDNFRNIPKIFDEIAAKKIPNLFAEMPKNAPEWFKNAFGKYLTDVETATNANGAFVESLDTSDMQKFLDELDKKIRDIVIDAQQAKADLEVAFKQKKEDLAIKFDFKVQDINTKYIQKGEDAAQDYANKVEDINKATQDKIADAKRKAREDEKQAEAQLLQKLKELRNQFLLDLDDALHARDARQVLRLIKEYNNDKQNLIDRKKLEDKERADKLAADLKNIEIEKNRKLEAAAIEYQQKLAQLQVAKQRELAEAELARKRDEDALVLWHQRELEEIDRHTKDKVERLLADYIQEGKITEEGMKNVVAIISKYAALGKFAVADMVGFMNQQMASLATMQMAAMQPKMPPAYGAPVSYAAPAATKSYNQKYKTSAGTFAGGLAEGGSIIADKPTVAIFGEKGRELASFTPLTRTGKDVNKVFSDTGGAPMPNSKVTVEMLLSPDLEARVIDNALNQTAEVVTRVGRMKQ